MQLLRTGASSGVLRWGTAWFRMDLEALGKISRCARALETSKDAFEAALKECFDPPSRRVARAFLRRRGRPPAPAKRPMDPSLIDFLDACKTLRFMDYSDPSRAEARDRARMTRYTAEEPPPPLSLASRFEGARPVRLPAVLQAIAASTFENRREVAFLDHRAGKRGVPSHGARHPFDAFFAWSSGSRTYEAYFDPVGGKAHRLARPRPPPGVLDASYRVRLYATYERVQWRYRHSGFYDTLLLDAGHILANVALVASSFGFHARTVSSPSEQPVESEALLGEVFLEVELTRAERKIRRRPGAV